MEEAAKAAAEYNKRLNLERKTQRTAYFDMQTFSVQYPKTGKGKMKTLARPPPGNYPVAELLLHCTKCDNSSHPTCVGLHLELLQFVTNYDWECTDCKKCMTCNDPADEDNMIFIASTHTFTIPYNPEYYNLDYKTAFHFPDQITPLKEKQKIKQKVNY